MTWLNPSTAESKISEKKLNTRRSNTSPKMVMLGNVKLKLKVLSSQFYPEHRLAADCAQFSKLCCNKASIPRFLGLFSQNPEMLKGRFRGKRVFMS